jgi:hypothetical protein
VAVAKSVVGLTLNVAPRATRDVVPQQTGVDPHRAAVDRADPQWDRADVDPVDRRPVVRWRGVVDQKVADPIVDRPQWDRAAVDRADRPPWDRAASVASVASGKHEATIAAPGVRRVRRRASVATTVASDRAGGVDLSVARANKVQSFVCRRRH